MQLRNPHAVAAEWSIKRPAVDSPKLRDWPFFAPEPAGGVLEPGARANIRVTFTPQARACALLWGPSTHCLLIAES